MDWDNIVTLIFMLWGMRYVVGLFYGIYLLWIRASNPRHWDMVDGIIVGLPFWFGWYTGRLLRWVMKKGQKRRAAK